MKKFLSLILISALALALTACGTPENNFVSAIDRFDDTKAVTCTFDNKVTAVINGETYEIVAAGKTLVNNKKEQFKVEGDAVTTYSGGTVTYKIDTVLDDDMMFSSTSGEGYKQEISFDDAQKALVGFTVIRGIGEDSFASINETSEAGNLRYEFKLNETGAAKLTGLTEQLTKILSLIGNEGSIKINGVSGKLALDNRKRPQQQDFTIEAEMTSGESGAQITYTIHTEFEMSGTNFDIAAPAGSADYKLLK